VPCDTPGFPLDLVARLAEGLQAADAQVAYAVTEEDGKRQAHPVFCLMSADVLESLIRFLGSGERKIDRWTAQHPCVEVLFEDASAFRNANTREELLALQPQRR
jgi:molybdenum cofactor guanylyltransferase